MRRNFLLLWILYLGCLSDYQCQRYLAEPVGPNDRTAYDVSPYGSFFINHERGGLDSTERFFALASRPRSGEIAISQGVRNRYFC